MTAKKRAELNQFFPRHHEDEEAKLPRNRWASLEKNNNFFMSLDYGSFEGDSLGRMPPMPSSLIRRAGFLRLYFAVNLNILC